MNTKACRKLDKTSLLALVQEIMDSKKDIKLSFPKTEKSGGGNDNPTNTGDSNQICRANDAISVVFKNWDSKNPEDLTPQEVVALAALAVTAKAFRPKAPVKPLQGIRTGIAQKIFPVHIQLENYKEDGVDQKSYSLIMNASGLNGPFVPKNIPWTVLNISYGHLGIHIVKKEAQYEINITYGGDEDLSIEDTLELLNPDSKPSVTTHDSTITRPDDEYVFEFLKATLEHYKSTKPMHKGGGAHRKTNIKKHVMGRDRVIYMLGRRQYIKIKGEYMYLVDARKM